MLTFIAPGINVWLGSGVPGSPNSTVISDNDGLTVIDSLISPAKAKPLTAACTNLGYPVKRLVATSSHIEYVGGSEQFPFAAVYGTPNISAHLDQQPNIPGCQQLFPEHAPEFEELSTRAVTHTVAEPAWITETVVAIPLAGELGENLAIQIPKQGVVVCGALASFGTRPLMFDGYPELWIESLDVLAGHGSIFIPGHGPVGSSNDIANLQSYIDACVAAQGDVTQLGSGPWDSWGGKRFDVVNVERAAMVASGDESPPPSMLRLLGIS